MGGGSGAAACTAGGPTETTIYNYTGLAINAPEATGLNGYGANKFSITGSYTITKYVISLKDVNDLGNAVAALFDDDGGSPSQMTGSAITGTSVTVAMSTVPSSDTLVTFTLATPKTGVSGTKWLRVTATGTDVTYYTNFRASNGVRVYAVADGYQDSWALVSAVYGCPE